MKSYDYKNRQGVKDISWNEFVSLSQELAERLYEHEVTTIVGIARAGLLPATALSCMLRKELYPVRITRRVRDQVVSESPVWKVDLPDKSLTGEVVAVIDEMADTGETLQIVASRAKAMGASRVVTVSLVAHSWVNPKPNLVGLTTDALVIFPWDKLVYQDKEWQMHPEIVEALRLQEQFADL